MKNSLKISAMLALLFFAATTVSSAQHNRRANIRMNPMGQCLDIPELSDTQKTQVTEINKTHRETIDNMREQFYAAEDVLSANEIKAKMTLEQNNHLNNISKILTEGQLIYFNENIIARPSNNGRKAYNRSPGGGRGNAYRGNGRGNNRRGNGRGAQNGYGRGSAYRGR
jgi:hypothetical protein